MMSRREALAVVAVALIGALPLTSRSIAAQPAASATITLTIEGMT